MRVLFTDASDRTLVCAFVHEVRYDRASRTMGLCCAESDFETLNVSLSDYDSFVRCLLCNGFLDLSSLVFVEV